MWPQLAAEGGVRRTRPPQRPAPAEHIVRPSASRQGKARRDYGRRQATRTSAVDMSPGNWIMPIFSSVPLSWMLIVLPAPPT